MSWPNRILLAVFVVAALAFLPKAHFARAEDLARVEREREVLRGQNVALAAEIRVLEGEVAALRGGANPEARERVAAEVARIARDDLNLLRPGEFMFELETSSAEAPE